MAQNRSNRFEQYGEAPDKKAEREALIERGMDLTEEKVRLMAMEPVNQEAIKAIDEQLFAAQDKYVKVMKEDFGSLLTPAQLRDRYQTAINRKARRSLSRDIRRDADVDVNINVVGAPAPLEARVAAHEAVHDAAARRESLTRQADDIRAHAAENLKDLDTDIDVYLKEKKSLVLIAQKFREAEPPLLASSLTSGDDMEYAITVALYQYPNLADSYIRALKAGGTEREEVLVVLKELEKDLDPYIKNLIEKEELQMETLKDDFTKHAGGRLKQVVEEFQRHPGAVLIGSAMLAGAIYAIWNGGNETVKKAMKWTGATAGIVIGGGALANMIVRSQTEDGRDLFDILGLRPQAVIEDSGMLDRISARYPELNIENNQSGRDLMRMLNSDCDDIYTVFHDAFREGKTEISPRALARMGAGPDDLSLSEASSMNGRASYTALEDFFVLLARKNGGEGSTRRETVENGLKIFQERFVGKAERPNLETAIALSIDQGDVRRASESMGVDLGFAGSVGGSGSTEVLDAAEQSRERGIKEILTQKGLDKWTDNQGHEHPTHVEVVPGRRDGATFVRINDYPFEYSYDSARKLHTFKDPVSGIELNVGDTVRDDLGKASENLAQQSVNRYFNGSPLESTAADTYRIHYDEQKKEWVAEDAIKVPEIVHMGLPERERHAAVVFRPGIDSANLRVQESDDHEGVGSYAALIDKLRDSRVEEVVDKDLKHFLGNLPVEVLEHGDPVINGTPDTSFYAVKIEWGRGDQKGLVYYENKKIKSIDLLEEGVEAPKELREEWENIAAQDAELLVQRNPDVQRVFTNLASAFAAKQGYPDFPTTLGGLKDAWDFIANLDLKDEDSLWLEAVNFEQSVLFAEVKRSIIEEYSKSLATDGGVSMLTQQDRIDKIRTEVTDKVIKGRLEKLATMTDQITGSTNNPGNLDTIQRQKVRELREAHITVDGYAEWFRTLETTMEGEAAGWDPDTVGIEGFKTSRLIHDAILLTLFEYTYPMSVDEASFNSDEGKRMRRLISQKLPTLISTAMRNKEGNWWIDQRYNTASFMAAMEAEGIKPMKNMNFEGLMGDLDIEIQVPVSTPDYDRAREGGEDGREREPVNVDQVPEPREGESPVDYSRRMADYLRNASIDLYSEIGDIEKSLRDDEFDNFINWRLERVVEEYNEYNRVHIDPNLSSAPNPANLNADIKKFSEGLIDRVKLETRDLKKYQLYIENPEGLFSYINPAIEADIDDWRKAERDMLRGVISAESKNRTEWQNASEEVLDWMDAEYQNESLMGLGVNWIRQDVMEIWMQKHNYGRAYPSTPDNAKTVGGYNASEIKEYRKFFTSVSEHLLSQRRFSANDWERMFRRNTESDWKDARGMLVQIPDFLEWKQMGSPARNEIDSLDWETNDELREYAAMRDQVDQFMRKDFDGIDVSQWTRLDGRWPQFFKEHAKARIELEILPKVKNEQELRKALGELKKALYVEAAFYDQIINSKIDAKQGTEHISLATPVLIIAGGLAGGSTGAAIGAPGGPIPGGIGALAGVTVGALGGYFAGQAVEALPIPQPGFDGGEMMHSKVRGVIDKAFKNHSSSITDPNVDFNYSGYADELSKEMNKVIQDGIAHEAEGYDFGPFSFFVPGSNIDRIELSP